MTLSSSPLAHRLIVALDMMTPDEARALAQRLCGFGVTFKIGMELFYRGGLSLAREVAALQSRPRGLFVDLKLHDIPNTAAMAAEALTAQGVDFFNVHASGGSAMMQAAAEGARRGAQQAQTPPPLLIAVTVLTSLDAQTLANELKIPVTPQAMATHLATLAQEAGLNGVVCSAQEAAAIRAACGPDFVLVTPGIRPAFGANPDDQARICSPADAIRAGADYLVVGRPVTRAADPVEAVGRILEEMASA